MKYETAPVLALVGGLVAVGMLAYGMTAPMATDAKGQAVADRFRDVMLFAGGLGTAGLIVWGLKK